MNILFLSEVFYPHGSGAELATYKYAKMLSQRGINVTVITNRFRNEPKLSKYKNLVIYRLSLFGGDEIIKYKILFNIGILFTDFFKKLIKWADIVYIPRLWFSALPIVKAYGKPTIVHLHDYIAICPLAGIYNYITGSICNSLSCSLRCIYSYEQAAQQKIKKKLSSSLLNFFIGRQLRRLIGFSDAIICVSYSHKDLICKKLPHFAEKIRVIYNPMPNCTLIKDPPGEDFAFLGGSNPLKGYKVLTEGIKKIPKTSNKIRFHLTKFEKQKFSQNLYSLPNLVDLNFYGKLEASLLTELYKNIRAICFPSIWPEPLPYAICEAILNGRLVIASKIGGVSEITKDCEGAFLFEAKNCAELAEKIKLVSSLDKKTVISLASQSRNIFLNKFVNEKQIDSFISLCNTLVSHLVDT